MVVGSLRGELFIGICPDFVSTFADHQRRTLVHFFWTGQNIAILRRARARQSWWASSTRLVAQTQFFSTNSLQTVWGNAKREGKTSKIMFLLSQRIEPINLTHKVFSLRGIKQHVVWRKTTRRLKKNNTSFEGKQHVVWRKTTRRLKKNNTSFEGKQHVVWKDTFLHSRWRADFTDFSLIPSLPRARV